MTSPRTAAQKKSGEWSETAKAYMFEKLAEMITDIPADRWQNAAMRWGTEWEAIAFQEARQRIAERLGLPVESPVGDFAFIFHPEDNMIGCSPDGIVGDDGLLELKCPYNPVNHIKTVLSGTMPPAHDEQVQGSLWITGRSFYVFASFDPRVEISGMDPLFMVRVERDEKAIAEIAERVTAFRDWLCENYAKLVGERPF